MRFECLGSLASDVWRDIVFATRAMRRAPAFSATAVLALALGLGATTAVLSIVDGVLLRPLPYADANRLVVVLHDGRQPVAPANYLDWKAQTRAFGGMGAAEYSMPDLTGGDDPQQLLALHVTPSLMRLLGVKPMLGRLFTDGDAHGENAPVLISDRLWQMQFGGARDIVGRAISLDARTYSIVGVMPPSFRFAPFWATGAELWAPLDLTARATSRTGQSLRVFARLAPGVGVARAQVDVDAVTQRLERLYPGTNRDVRVVPLRDKVVGPIREPLLILLAAVCLTLLIACSNVAHMLLARGSARATEMAVRLAIGASAGRLRRQLLVESGLLALAGGLAGAGLAVVGVRAVAAAQPAFVPRVATIEIDWRVLGAALVLIAITTLLCGLAPALEATHARPADAIRDGAGGSSTGAMDQRMRDALVVSEFALALVLLVGAGLMIRSFVALRSVDPGFDVRNLLTMQVATTGTPAADSSRHAAFYMAVLDRLRATPGIESASFINHLPIAGDAWGFHFHTEGGPTPRPGDWPRATYRVVMPGYFATMGIHIVRGRDVSGADRPNSTAVAVINEYMAHKHWPGRDPIGQRFVLDDSTRITVVGLVPDVVQQDWSAPRQEEVYVPFFQAPAYVAGTGASRSMTLVVRVRCAASVCNAAGTSQTVRDVVRGIEHGAPISEVQSMRAVVDRATGDARLYFLMLTMFAAVGAALAAIGIYGVVSYAVARRQRELGIRLALGADASMISRLVLGHTARLAVAGAATGIALALVLAPLLRELLYGVGALDPLVFAAAAASLGLVALAASAAPIRRAAKIDPVITMRS